MTPAETRTFGAFMWSVLLHVIGIFLYLLSWLEYWAPIMNFTLKVFLMTVTILVGTLFFAAGRVTIGLIDREADSRKSGS